MRRRGGFTLIELMIVVIIVAILAASAYPIYRSIVSRAYEAEIVSGLSVFRTAERTYFAEHGEYTTLANLEAAGLVAADDFRDMKYVLYSDYSIPSSSAVTFTVRWTRPPAASGRDVADYRHATVEMDQSGNITRA